MRMASAMTYWLAALESLTVRVVPVTAMAVPRSFQLVPASARSLGATCWLTVAVATWVAPSNTENGELVAFDTGPGNAQIDDWMRRFTNQTFDENGSLAARGEVLSESIREFVDSSYFLKYPPKSLDRNDFRFRIQDNVNVEDGISTLTYCTCLGISLAQTHFPTPARKWIVCGGGSRNETIMDWLIRLVDGRVTTGSDYGWDVEALEAQAFGFMAVRHLRGLPNSFPSTTGASRPIVGGVLHHP